MFIYTQIYIHIIYIYIYIHMCARCHALRSDVVGEVVDADVSLVHLARGKRSRQRE